MVKVTQAFDGVPDGEVYPRRFEVGSDVSGDLAAVAVAQGWAGDPLQGLKDAVKSAGQSVSKAKKALKSCSDENKAACQAALGEAEAVLLAAQTALKEAREG